MTDINLLRWLALRTIERDRDLQVAVRQTCIQEQIIRSVFQRHSWIRLPSDDPADFVSEFLSLVHGVESVAIDGWIGASFSPHSPDNVLSFGVTCAIQI